MGNAQFDRQTLISAVTNKTIQVISGSDSSAVPTGGTYVRITILSPTHTVSNLFNLRLDWNVNPTATTGTRTMGIDQEVDVSNGIGLFSLTGAYNSWFMWDQGDFVATSSHSPADISAMSSQIQAGRFDEFKGIQIWFKNETDQPDTGLRRWTLFVEREVVSR